ncbi:MAG: cupin domain-containing protein [Mycobacterium sp.]|uniref:cupin domain-containing protein n=1 Tax=Mycobacterium sp. TaxID=1785 RepID=UPI00389A1A26
MWSRSRWWAKTPTGRLSSANRFPAPRRPPPHRHRREDEIFCVLEGEYEFVVGDRTIPATAGSVVYGPRNIPHTF